MKRSKQCPKCDSKRIGYLPTQVDANDAMENAEHGRFERVGDSKPRALGRSAEVTNTGTWTGWGDIRHLLGRLEAYFCADCGYHETYIADVKSLDVEKLEGFSWLNEDVQHSGPLR